MGRAQRRAHVIYPRQHLRHDHTVEGVGREVVDQISNWESTVDLSAELKRIKDFGATVITQNSPEYPKALREIHSPPIVLYVWGEIQPRDHHAIAVIGARRTTHYGMESAKKLSYQIAYAGLTVISGLARGIDTAAHHGAIAAKGRTIAVIGSGLMEIYPPENRALAEKIRSEHSLPDSIEDPLTWARTTDEARKSFFEPRHR